MGLVLNSKWSTWIEQWGRKRSADVIGYWVSVWLTVIKAAVDSSFPCLTCWELLCRMSPVGTKRGCRSISTKNIHTTWQATRGSCGQHEVPRPVHVISNNCGQIEQAEPTSVHFTPAWHGSGLGLQRAVCHPSAALWSTPASGISGSHLWNKPPWRFPTWDVCSHLQQRSDVGFCSHHTGFSDPFSLLLGFDNTVRLREMCSYEVQRTNGGCCATISIYLHVQ